MRVYTAKNCMASALNEICQLYRHETCGRCVFGHEGSHQIATIVADVCRKKGKPSDLALLRDLCPVMQSQCLCEQGRVMARTVMAFLDLFETEISAHIGKKTCPAGVQGVSHLYHILASKCQACNACVDSCEEDAILGRPRFIHVIDQKACTQCGACLGSCEYGAIVTAGINQAQMPARKPIPFRKRWPTPSASAASAPAPRKPCPGCGSFRCLQIGDVFKFAQKGDRFVSPRAGGASGNLSQTCARTNTSPI